MAKPARHPTELELEILKVLWEGGPMRVRDVREAVEEYCAGQRARDDADPVALVERLVTYPGSGRGDLAQRSEEYLREMARERRRRRSR